MKIIKRYILFLLLPACLFTCKKYPEGGCERRGPKNILGNWKLALYEVNGIDSTDLINYNNNDGYKSIKISKLKTSNSDYTLQIDGRMGIGLKIVEKNKKLEFYSDYNSKYCQNLIMPQTCYRVIFSPSGGKFSWEIVKLTKNDLIITSSSAMNYTIRLTK